MIVITPLGKKTSFIPTDPSETAGGKSQRWNDMQKAARIVSVNTRSYLHKDEVNRQFDIRQRNLSLTLDHSYKRVTNDNLWNEKTRLPASQHKYWVGDHTFRPSPQNIELIQMIEQQENLSKTVNRQSVARNDSLKRQQLRTLENQILIHKSEQPLHHSSKRQVQALEVVDPAMFEELLNRKKWRGVAKDPQRTLRDENLDKTQFWSHLNNMPQSRVDLILDERVIEHDRSSCGHILNKIYEDAQQEELKLKLQQQERQKVIAKLHERHNQVTELEKNSGVRLGNFKYDDGRDDVERGSFEFQSEGGKEWKVGQAAQSASKVEKMRNDSMGDLESLTRTQPRGIALKFDARATQPLGVYRDEILAIPKPDYRGKDFFQRPEFRGLIIADYQNAIGDKAKDSVELLNKTTVSKFPQLKTFQDSFNQQKKIERFYKSKQSNASTFSERMVNKTIINDQSMQMTGGFESPLLENNSKTQNLFMASPQNQFMVSPNSKSVINSSLDPALLITLQTSNEQQWASKNKLAQRRTSVQNTSDAQQFRQQLDAFELQWKYGRKPQLCYFQGSKLTQKNVYNVPTDFTDQQIAPPAQERDKTIPLAEFI